MVEKFSNEENKDFELNFETLYYKNNNIVALRFDYEYFDIGLTREGKYREIFNSDKDVYGGSNAYNGLDLVSKNYGPENKPYSMSVKLAPYAAMIFKYVKE